LKLPGFAFFVAAGLAGAAFAQQSPSEVTDAEIARYKQTAQQGCREPGMARGDPQEMIDAFCNCILATLEKNLKRTEWQQLYFYSLKKQDVEERVVLEPHIKGLAVCRGK
jgi:hypothetical protein